MWSCSSSSSFQLPLYPGQGWGGETEGNLPAKAPSGKGSQIIFGKGLAHAKAFGVCLVAVERSDKGVSVADSQPRVCLQLLIPGPGRGPGCPQRPSQSLTELVAMAAARPRPSTAAC